MVAGRGRQWSSYKVTILWEFTWAGPSKAVLDEWLSNRSGRLKRFDCVLFPKILIIYQQIGKNIFPTNGLLNPLGPLPIYIHVLYNPHI